MRKDKTYRPGTGLMILCLLLLTAVATAQVEVGEKAPKFKATDEQGNVWKLSDHLGERVVVLYFYPAAMTGGCTKQACSYRDKMNMLSALNTVVVGISGDEAQNLRWFKEAENLNFPLLSDEKGSIARKFGVPVKDGATITRNIGGMNKQLHREVTTARWTFIIDLEGKVVYKDTSVNAAEDSNKVIEAIKNL